MSERAFTSVLSTVTRVREVCTLTPFDTSSEAGRSKERYRRLILTAASSGLCRATGVLSLLFTVPLTISYLGKDRYGAWMTISSLVALLSFSDLGLGNGLVTALSQAEGRGDREFAKRAVSSVLLCLIAIALVIIAVFFLFRRLVSWENLLGLGAAQNAGEVRAGLSVIVICFAVGLPVNLVRQVQMALQSGALANLWAMLASVLSVAAVFAAAKLQLSIPWLVGIVSGAPLVAGLLNYVWFFYRDRSDLRPAWSAFRFGTAFQLLRLGFLFFVLAIAGALAFNSQNIVIAHVLGPSQVTEYALVQRLYSIIPMVVGLITQPLWPAFGEAVARGEWTWVRRTLWRAISINGVIAAMPAIILLIFGESIVHIWTKGQVSTSHWLLAGFSLWVVISAICSPICMLLNAAGAVLFQVVSSLLFAGITVLLSVFLVSRFGLPALIWSIVFVYILLQMAPYLLLLRKRSWMEHDDH